MVCYGICLGRFESGRQLAIYLPFRGSLFVNGG
jgi:hypothetical protein